MGDRQSVRIIVLVIRSQISSVCLFRSLLHACVRACCSCSLLVISLSLVSWSGFQFSPCDVLVLVLVLVLLAPGFAAGLARDHEPAVSGAFFDHSALLSSSLSSCACFAPHFLLIVCFAACLERVGSLRGCRAE